MPLDFPDDCSGNVVPVANAKTSVAGFVQIGIASLANASDARHRLCNPDPLRDILLAATVS